MRNLLDLAAYAIALPGVPDNTSLGGCFEVPCPATGARLRVVASALLGWDHVSVSLPRRCPNWPEMARVKALFFDDHECAMQLHVPATDHVDNHPFCLHLWRPHGVAIPRPHAAFVGIPGLDLAALKALAPEEVERIRTGALGELEAAAQAGGR